MAQRVVVSPVPAEAELKGTLNESTPVDQRAPDSKAPKTEGPKRGEKHEFLPATYPTVKGNLRTDR